MQEVQKTRSTVTISKNTDIALRTFLAQRGLNKGDVSKFIEDAVKWRVLDQTITETRTKLADLPQDDVQAVADEATSAVRKQMRTPLAKTRDPCGSSSIQRFSSVPCWSRLRCPPS